MNSSRSENLVCFINTKNYAFDIQKPMNMLLEFVVDPEVVVALGKDWVAIFPKDSHLESPINKDLLNQMVTFEHVMQRPVNKDEGKYQLNFSLCGSKNLIYGQEYKFVYCNVDFEILGVSRSFKIFDLNKEVESLQQDVSKLNFRDNSNNPNNSMTQWKKKAQNNRKSREVSLQDDCQEVDLSETTVAETTPYNAGYSNRSKHYGGFNQVHQASFQPHVRSPPCFSATNSCNNCSRVGSLLSSQSDLYMQVKNLAEEKSALIQRVSCLEKQVELGQAAYQKQSVLLLQEREIRINLQREVEMLNNYQPVFFVYSSVCLGFDSYRRPLYSIFPVMFFSRVPLQKEYVCAEIPNTSRVADFKKQAGGIHQSHMMKLKAILGHQEKKICSLTERLIKEEDQVRFLTQKLAELQAGENICKVKIVETEVDATVKKLWSETPGYNNNEGEETSDID